MVFIVLGAIKAAQIVRGQCKKNDERNGVIMPLTETGDPQLDAYVAQHRADWWESTPSNSRQRDSKTKMIPSSGASSKNPHSVSAWDRRSAQDLSSEISSSEAPRQNSTSVPSSSLSSKAGFSASRLRVGQQEKDENNTLPLVTDFSELPLGDSKSNAQAQVKSHARAKSTPPLAMTQTSPYSTPPGSPSPTGSEESNSPPSKSAQLPPHVAGSFNAAFSLTAASSKPTVRRSTVRSTPDVSKKPALASISCANVDVVSCKSSSNPKQASSASLLEQPNNNFGVPSALAVAGTHKRPPRPGSRPASAITSAADLTSVAKATARAKESFSSPPEQSSSAMASSSALSIPGTHRRPVRPGMRRTDNSNPSNGDARASSSPVLHVSSGHFVQGSMRRQNPPVPLPSAETANNSGLLAEKTSAFPVQSSLAAPGALKKRSTQNRPQ